MDRPGTVRRCQLDGCEVELTGQQRRWCSDTHRKSGFNHTPKGLERHRRYRKGEAGRATHARRLADPARVAAMREAAVRYQTTAQGMLAKARSYAKQRGNR